MLKNGRPYHLPQISAPYDVVIDKLQDDGINCEMVEINPSEDDGIQSSQNVIFSDDVNSSEINDLNPIWISNYDDNINICDGHHRYFQALMNNLPIKAIKVNAEFKDVCRILNKIQDIYEYENSHGVEEVEMQDIINYYGDDENQFLTSLEEDNLALQTEESEGNVQTIIAYRKEPIKKNSVVGNFFSLKPIEGYDKYEIDFDNLLDTSALGVTYKDGQEPVDILAKSWFPHVNFEKLGNQYGVPSINLKNKAVAEKAVKFGYDGIKYGDTLIQGLK